MPFSYEAGRCIGIHEVGANYGWITKECRQLGLLGGVHSVERKDIGCNLQSITALRAHSIKRRASWPLMPSHVSAVQELCTLSVVESMRNACANRVTVTGDASIVEFSSLLGFEDAAERIALTVVGVHYHRNLS
jgi:hypothetical protein